MRIFFENLKKRIRIFLKDLKKRMRWMTKPFWLIYFITARSSRNDLVAITYANDWMPDGAGSQLHKMYSTYAVSRLLNVTYIHSPLIQLNYQGLAVLENNSPSQDIVSEYNKVFCIPSDIDLPKEFVIRDIEPREVRPRTFRKLRKEATKKGIFILARLGLVLDIADEFTECYEAVKEISPFPFQPSSVIKIAVHVRRGELLVVDSWRMLPNEYYLFVIKKIREILDSLDLNYVFELYTELPTKVFTVSPTHHGIGNRISDSIIVDPKSNKIEDFDSVPNLKKFINTDPIETIQRMALANILIMSHSSFSYLAAILNVKGVKIYHKFWHNPLKDWVISNNSGHFSKSKFIEKLKESGFLSNY
jgi:hypothetical protein